MGNKVFDLADGKERTVSAVTAETGDVLDGDVEIDFSHLDAPRRVALASLCRAFDLAEAGTDYFAMRKEMGKVEDGVQAVWYAAQVRRAAGGD